MQSGYPAVGPNRAPARLNSQKERGEGKESFCVQEGEGKSFADFAGGHFVAFFPPPRWDLPWRVAVVSQRERSARKRELNLVHAFFRHVKEGRASYCRRQTAVDHTAVDILPPGHCVVVLNCRHVKLPSGIGPSRHFAFDPCSLCARGEAYHFLFVSILFFWRFKYN